jgi:hypothetical protein
MARLVQLADQAVAAAVRLAAQRQAVQEIHRALHRHRATKAAMQYPLTLKVRLAAAAAHRRRRQILPLPILEQQVELEHHHQLLDRP